MVVVGSLMLMLCSGAFDTTGHLFCPDGRPRPASDMDFTPNCQKPTLVFQHNLLVMTKTRELLLQKSCESV